MKKLHEWGSRTKAKVKKILESDGESTRPSTPAPPNIPTGTIPLVLNQTSPNLPSEPTECSISTNPYGPVHDRVQLNVPSAAQTGSHISLAPAGPVPSRPSTPNPNIKQVGTPTAAHVPLPATPDATHTQVDVAPPAVEQSSVDPPAVAHVKSGLSGSDTWSWIKSEGWTNLRELLDTLGQAASVTGLGPIKEVAEGFAKRIGVFEEAAQDRKEYSEMKKKVDSIFGELREYCSCSPVISTSMESICGSITKEMEHLENQLTKPTIGRLAKAETDADNVIACYGRIQDHLQRLTRNANMSTWKIVDELATEHRIKQLAPSMWPCYNSEKESALERRACTEGTRTDVLAQMHAWINKRSTGNVYWINGMAGTGKTTIAYSFCKQLDQSPDRLLCASFFCSRSLPECRDVGRIIPSIAYQLARRSQPFRYALSQATEKDPDAHTRSPHLQFERLIIEPLSNQQVKEALPANMVVVIDALDECEDAKSTGIILDVLLSKSEGTPIKFVVSSRPEAVIRDQMGKKYSYDSGVVLHELDSGEVKTDIKTYLNAELAPINPSLAEIEKLVERAGVLFIYAATVVRYVGYDDFGMNPRRRLKAVLGVSGQPSQTQHEEIDQLYSAILKAAISNKKLDQTERDDIKLVLNTVVCARSPLTVNALNGLLKLGDVERVDAALRPLWSVLHVMGPNKTVTTLHASFPDYLTDPKRASQEWYCNAAVHSGVLAGRCFEYIRDTKPQFNVCQLPSSFLDDNQVEDIDARINHSISAELRYACQYWPAHLDTSDPGATSTLMAQLDRFLTTNLLLWMEVMNLTKNMPACPDNLSMVKRWIMPHSPGRELLDLIQDATRFANTIVSTLITQSTPHIYISMLPFLPSHSPIRKHYAHRMQRLVGVAGTALDRRKALLARWYVRHGNGPTFSADGTLLAIGPNDEPNGVFLIQTSSGRLVRDMSCEGAARVTCIAFSPDDARIACGTMNGAVWVWDVSSGQTLLGPLEGHTHMVACISFSSDGSRIISGSLDSSIRIWDARSGECVLGPLEGHTDEVWCLTISSDNKVLISGSKDETALVWNIENGCATPNRIPGHTRGVTSVAFSPNNRWFVTGSGGGTLRVWDTRTGEMMLGPLAYKDRRPTSITISPGGTLIAAGYEYNNIHIWDATTGNLMAILPRGSPYVNDVLRYSPDNSRLISYCNCELLIFDAESAAVAPDTLPGHTEAIYSIDISPDGKHIVSGSYDTTLCVWDPATGHLIHGPLTGHSKTVVLVRYSPDGSRFLSCSQDRTLCQWNAQTGVVYEVDDLIINPSPPEGSWTAEAFSSATYSPDGSSIAVTCREGDVYIWDSGSGKLVRKMMNAQTRERRSIACAFSIDGGTLIQGWSEGEVRIWDVQTGQLVSCHQMQGCYSVSILAFSPDRLHTIIADYDGRLHQRSIGTGERISGPFIGHNVYALTVQYSSDGNHIVSGSLDNTVHIWDAQTATSVFGPLRGHTTDVMSVAYSPDGTYVASASYDTVIRIWDARPNKNNSQVDGDPTIVDWVLNDDGWVVDEQSQRLIWVPLNLRASLMSPRNTTLISQDGYVQLDFKGALIGEGWGGCWKNS